jgi:two-component system sensor histidine kinase PilS (NtrC family)
MALFSEHRDQDTLPGGISVHTWRPLRVLNFYRMALAAVFTVLYFAGMGPAVLGKYNPALFEVTSVAYLAFSLASAIMIRQRVPAFPVQVNLQALGDVAAITLLMHASGGLTSGLGILLVAAIAGVSIILEGRLAGFYAAVATLAVLTEQVYAQLTDAFATTAYTHAGLLGVTFFATALLAHVLARRARESEALARQRGVDLASLEQVNDYIIRTMQSGVVVVDGEDRIRMLNEAAWQLLGMPSIRERQALATVAPKLATQLGEWKQDPNTAPRSFQAREDAPNALPRFAPLGSSAAAGAMVFLEDATEATQRMQQMKLASLGRLTASIAHEIRNPLGAISHAGQLLGESEHLDRNDQRLAEIVRDHAQRMNRIVENVLQLSRREASQPRSIELKPWLEEFAEELRAAHGLAPSEVTVVAPPEERCVQFDPSHLQQVLWNLCQNAIQHARQPGHDFRLLLRVGLTEESRSPCLDVIDNGPGIDPEEGEQVFEPFYTTASGGTGLGLYIARELCEVNRARLALIPTPSGGSCFRISFYTVAHG